MKTQCRSHKEYKGIVRPSCREGRGCDICWSIYSKKFKTMNLYLIEDSTGWGWRKNIVRAPNEEEALKYLQLRFSPKVTITELNSSNNEFAILYSDEQSPDSCDYD